MPRDPTPAYVMILEGHPSKGGLGDQGAAPLPGTNHSKRLLRHGRDNPYPDAHLLVKAEWDEIEKWMEINVDP